MVSVAKIEARKENLAPRNDGWDIRLLVGEELPGAETTSDPLAGRVRNIQKLRAKSCSKQVPINLADEYTSLIDEFKEWDMYKNDLRLVRVCLEYAGMSRDPSQMFVFMQKYRIGVKCSLFYESWSNYLETIGKIDKALIVLDSGVSEGAQPVEYMETLQCELYKRQQEAIDVHKEAMHPSTISLTSPSNPKIMTLGPNVPTVKKRKFTVYSDQEPSIETGTTLPPLPRINTDRKENSAPSIGFHPIEPQSELNKHVVSQAIETQNSMLLTESQFNRLSFSEKLLIMRPFTSPISSSGTRILLSESFNDLTTNLIKHDERLYQKHNRHTEVLIRPEVRMFSIGDTEVLKYKNQP